MRNKGDPCHSFYRCLFWITIFVTDVTESCIVTVPSSVRLGAEETVLIVNRGELKNATLVAQDYPGRAHLLYQKTLTLHPNESRVVPMKLDYSQLSAQDVHSDHYREVSLTVECGNDFRKEARLLINKNEGYLLLQSDKPIYTPDQTVNLRLVVVGEDLKPSKKDVELEIKNPQGISVHKKTWKVTDSDHGTGMYSLAYKFTDYPILGEWTAVARSGAHQTQKSEMKFKLDEYALPTFSVVLSMSPAILPSEEVLRGSLTAKHVYGERHQDVFYGEPVQGSAIIRFKVRNEANDDMEIGEAIFEELRKGRAEFALPTPQDLKDSEGRDWSDTVRGNRLVVEASVFEKATGKSEKAVHHTSVFASSPYMINFKHTPRDFKPGASTVVVAEILHVNMEPANNVSASIVAVGDNGTSIRFLNEERKTDATGRVAFTVTTFTNLTFLNVTVRTKDKRYREEEQAEGSVLLSSYTSASGGLVSLKRVDVRSKYKVEDNYDSIVTTVPTDLHPVYYMVLSRGQIKAHGILVSESSQLNHKQILIKLTEGMIPGFRVLVYAFYKGHLLADSQAIEMQETCTQASKVAIKVDFPIQEPAATGKFKLEGTEGTRVGFLAVDKAVYLLNKGDLLSNNKLLGMLQSHDLGCGPGGGVTTDETLSRAGVVILSKEAQQHVITTENSCESQRRRRRSLVKRSVDGYEDPYLKRCCELGVQRDRMARHCSTRAEIVRKHLEGPRGEQCAEAFSKCCTGEWRIGTDRGRVNKQDPFLPDNDVIEDKVPPRSDFRETWFFNDYVIGPNGVTEVWGSLPHSITTWSVQAVSLAPTGGVCVAEPAEVHPFRHVFIHVSVPYRVVRNEQVQVLVTVHNYGSSSLSGYLTMHADRNVCTGATNRMNRERVSVMVSPNSATSVAFPVVPLSLGSFKITVVFTSNIASDTVEKLLHAVPEGVTVERSVVIPIDPTNEQRMKSTSTYGDLFRSVTSPDKKRQVVSINTLLPLDAVPNTKLCSVTIIGNKMGPTADTGIANVESLISMPKGCGEQNMMLMAPTLYTLDYLKRKNGLNDSVKEKTYAYLRRGYEQELSFRKPDGSFATFKNREGNLWLTAFVLRVFCKARHVIHIDPEVIESGILWLSQKQGHDGEFRDEQPLMHGYMLGGIRGRTAMTAFVLLTLRECGPSSVSSQENVVEMVTVRAEHFLNERFNATRVPYVAALVAYALSLGDGAQKIAAFEFLKDHVSHDPEMNTRGTGDESTALDVEGTSYALLAHLRHGDLESSTGFVNWLNTHRSASGSFTSTQDTIVALQALSEFAASATDTSPNLVCDVTNVGTGSSLRRRFTIMENNADILQELIIPDAGERLQVIATGTGNALLSVKLKYNVLVPPEKRCKFSLKIRAELFRPGGRSNNTLFPPAMLKELAVDKGGTVHSDDRRRISRSTGQRSKKKQSRGVRRNPVTYEIEVCSRYLEGNDSNMAILDVGLFSGFIARKEDLDKAIAENDLIGKYEQTGKGIVFYLDKVPAKAETCVKFRAKREYEVGNIRTAAVKVYDYYTPDHSCSQFYGPESSSPLLQLFCDGPSCKCASAECPVNETFAHIAKGSPRDQKAALERIACDDHDFVWKGRVDSQYVVNGYRYIQFRVDKVIKKGGEDTEKVLSSSKIFVARELCDTANLIVGRKYFIFGQDGEFFESNGDAILRYPMNNMVRIYSPEENRKAKWAPNVKTTFAWLTGPFVEMGGCQE